jgi:hypothetical protein
MMGNVTVGVTTTVEINEDVEVDLYDVLDNAEESDIIDYVVDNLDHDEIRSKLNGDDSTSYDQGELMDYLVNEYFRGAFSDFDFDKFFDRIDVKFCKCPTDK